jgi:hypothetical protein
MINERCCDEIDDATTAGKFLLDAIEVRGGERRELILSNNAITL